MGRFNFFLRVGVCFLLVFSATSRLLAQLDSVFWFVAPEISQNGLQNLDRPIKLNIASFSNSPIHVSVSQPANSSFAPIIRTIPPNGTLTVDLTPFMDMVENKPENKVLPYGLLIQSSDLVNVSYEVNMGEANPEMYTLKGRNALGTDFLIPGQNEYKSGIYTPVPLNRIDLVATENNTTISITPSRNMVGHPAGNPFTVHLNRGETYSCIATGQAPTDHLQGTAVTSNKPIAITVSDDLLHCPDRGEDLVGDQIVPLPVIGQEYIAVSGSLLFSTDDKVYVLGTANNTSLFVNGNTTARAIINRGETYVLGYSGMRAVYFTSDKPVYAFQLTGMGREFGGALLPSIRCTGSKEVKYKRSTGEVLKVNIAVPAGGENGFLINGNPAIIKASDFSYVPGTNNAWLFASKEIPVSVAPHNSLISLSNDVYFHLGVLEGGAIGGCSYGFFSNYGSVSSLTPTSNYETNKHFFCEGDDIRLFLENTSGLSGIRWEGPNGFFADAQEIGFTNAVMGNAGTYTVKASSTSGCEVLPASIDVTILPPPVADLTDEIHECESSVTLNAPGSSGTYLWSTGETSGQITVTQSGKYWLKASNEGCSRSDTVAVFLHSAIPADILQNGTLCENGSVQLSVSSGGGTVLWSTGETATQITSTASGKHWVRVEKGDCSSSDTVYIAPGIKPSLEISQQGNLCEEGAIVLEALSNSSSIRWNTGDTTSFLTITAPGYYSVQAFDYQCFVEKGIAVECPCDILYPNCFTPNGDGLNDFFFPVSSSFIGDYNVHIYNRWGGLIFKSTDPEQTWDGTDHGTQLPSGVYAYVVKYTCSGNPKAFVKHGSILLLR